MTQGNVLIPSLVTKKRAFCKKLKTVSNFSVTEENLSAVPLSASLNN